MTLDQLHDAVDQIAEQARAEVIEQIIAFLTESGYTKAAIAIGDGYVYTSQD